MRAAWWAFCSVGDDARDGRSGGSRNDDLETFEVVAEEPGVARDQAAALQQRVRADQEVGNGARRSGAALGLHALLVPPLHFPCAYGGAGIGRRVADSGLLEDVEQLGAEAEPGVDLADDDVADHDRTFGEGEAQARL